MAWMKSIGIRGIKVDFFGGDKQVTMKLYEDILFDANDYGLMVIFHGCTTASRLGTHVSQFCSQLKQYWQAKIFIFHKKVATMKLSMPVCTRLSGIL